MKPSLVVFLHSDRYDRLYQAVGLVLTASSMGWPCHLFLFYGALGSYMAGTWDDVNISQGDDTTTSKWIRELQDSFETGNQASLYDMLGKAKEEPGGVRVYACSGSCKAMGLDTAAVRGKVDEIVGLATMLRVADDAKHVMYV